MAMNKLIIVLSIMIVGCTHPVEPVLIPVAAPTIIDIWVHDTTPALRLEIQSGGTYVAHYLSLSAVGIWSLIPDRHNVIEVQDNICTYAAIGLYTFEFTDNGMYLLGNDPRCRGRLDKWAGHWTREQTI